MANDCISPALLARVPRKRSKDAHKRFKLGLDEWTESSSSEEESSEKENQGQVRKRLKLSLDKKGKKEDKSSRWHFVSAEEQDSYLPNLFL